MQVNTSHSGSRLTAPIKSDIDDLDATMTLVAHLVTPPPSGRPFERIVRRASDEVIEADRKQLSD